MEAIEELTQLSDSMRQAAAVLADEDVDEKTPSRRPSTFLNVIALGNVVGFFIHLRLCILVRVSMCGLQISGSGSWLLVLHLWIGSLFACGEIL